MQVIKKNLKNKTKENKKLIENVVKNPKYTREKTFYFAGATKE